ncbi:polysaccharide deacetylase family protein [Paenibacillus sp. J2TS4]|uniref:polysaccharide deacetylase family protein n=1 Tax=Paenibacillus sp. J2TS4 TaxID=2807194 RepID=UPI001B0501F7|nr:polysaccharide deacetylase family protein [Paenibacillus sp. J2TS4]GIP32360.1 hypothetical protein J2TS4_15700 [Paenibacillus sp. J2TS4]
MKKTWTILALSAALLTGCAATEPKDLDGSPNATADTTPVPVPSPSPTIEPTPEPAEEAQVPEEPAKAYRMNQNYILTPIDPEGNKKVVLLTFDDGPKDRDMIESMLDTLDKHDAKAIFFVNGYRVEKNPELLELIHSRGQTIGNHSWDHIDLKQESQESIDKQIEDVQRIVTDITGSAPAFFRPPFGSANDYVKQKVKEEGALFMTWSNGSLDWDASTKDKPEAVIQNVMDQLHPGSNILMHELPWTVEALDTLLNQLEEEGYGFIDPRTIETDSP